MTDPITIGMVLVKCRIVAAQDSLAKKWALKIKKARPPGHNFEKAKKYK
jgi:hypothetical protein